MIFTAHSTSQLSSASLVDVSQLQSLLEIGGPVILILVLMSVISLTVIILKCWQFFWMQTYRYQAIQQALKHWYYQQPQEALATLNNTRNPIARVLESAIHLKINQADDVIAREEVIRIAKRELANARSYLKVLEVIAALSPLLGLLGTVLGMIAAFQTLQQAGPSVDPALLSGGIWEALATTAAGLIVAIPTVAVLNWLEQCVERFKYVMEDTMTQIFTRDTLTQTQKDSPSPLMTND